MAKIYIKWNIQNQPHISCVTKAISPFDVFAVKFFVFDCILKGQLNGLEFLSISDEKEYSKQHKI